MRYAIVRGLFALTYLTALQPAMAEESDPIPQYPRDPPNGPTPPVSPPQTVPAPGKKAPPPVLNPIDFSGSSPINGLGGGKNPKAPNPKDTPPSKNNDKKTDCNTTKLPVIIATGEKVKTETDFAGEGLYPLGLARQYHGFGSQTALMFGNNWTSSYEYHLYALGCDHDTTGDFPKTVCIPHTYELDTPNGSFVYTKTSNYNYKVYGSDAMGRIHFDGPGTPSYVRFDDYGYGFDSSGKITGITDQANANVLTFQYSGSSLISVTNPGNQSIHFTWNGGHVSQVTDPRGQIWSYGYTPAGMLQTVTSPDSHVITYGYEASHSTWLNSITVDGTKVLAVTYQTNGQVASSGDSGRGSCRHLYVRHQ